jgi:acyl carrier protein
MRTENTPNDPIFEKIKKIVMDTTGLQEDEIKMEANFTEDLGIDSILLAELIMMLEDGFHVRISDADAEKIRTVGDVVHYLEQISPEK